ncbi:MAG: hypothetical protein LBE22_09435 [Azoarcus sp.]|jgi:transcription elongation factor|nr:hypothetical protein [Azoarcus sp.]
MKEIHAFCHFCDDIRFEIGNKRSLIGIYTNKLIAEAIPTTLSRLCIEIIICLPIKNNIDYIKIISSLNSEVIGEMIISGAEASEMSKKTMEDDTVFEIVSLMSFSPLVVKEPSILEVSAMIGDKEIPAGRLHISQS